MPSHAHLPGSGREPHLLRPKPEYSMTSNGRAAVRIGEQFPQHPQGRKLNIRIADDPHRQASCDRTSRPAVPTWSSTAPRATQNGAVTSRSLHGHGQRTRPRDARDKEPRVLPRFRSCGRSRAELYNAARPHTSLGGLTPNEFAAQSEKDHNRNGFWL